MSLIFAIGSGALVQSAIFAPGTSAALPALTHIHTIPNFDPTIPPKASGCHGAKPLSGGAEAVPLTVSSGGEGQVGATLNVCIDGHGPYPFLLDSGAGQTVIDANLAQRLHLLATGKHNLKGDGGCVDHTEEVTVDSWSADGFPLAGQQFAADTEPGQGGKGEPVGLLGNDVLSRFGAVKVDFKGKSLVLPGSEGAPLSSDVFEGPRGSAPIQLTDGKGVVLPVLAQTGPQDDYLYPSVTLQNGASGPFAVDTGASRSTIETSLTKEASMKTTNLVDQSDTVCSVVTTPVVRTGDWSIDGAALNPQVVDSQDINVADIKGIIGADALASRNWVVLDYTGALLVLGP